MTDERIGSDLPETGTPEAETEHGKHTGRKIVVSLLVILGLLLLFLANFAFWTTTTVLNTDRWVNMVAPITRDPEIAEAIGVIVVNQISEASNIDNAMSEILPERFGILINPLSDALAGLVEEAVTKFVLSDVVNAVWVTTNRVAHTLVINVLEGRGDVVYLETGQLVVDLSPLINAIKDNFGLGRLDLDLVGDDGKIVLLENEQVAVLQQIVSILNAVKILLPLITLLVLAVAVWVSLWRRKTILWIGIGVVAAMLLTILIYNLAGSWLLVSITDPLVRLFAGEILDIIMNGLLTQTMVLLVIGVLIIVGAWLAGPGKTAVKIRNAFSSG